jgi:hypothetical protein
MSAASGGVNGAIVGRCQSDNPWREAGLVGKHRGRSQRLFEGKKRIAWVRSLQVSFKWEKNQSYVGDCGEQSQEWQTAACEAERLDAGPLISPGNGVAGRDVRRNLCVCRAFDRYLLPAILPGATPATRKYSVFRDTQSRGARWIPAL